jgi:nucleoid DNA-binding protein
MPENTMFEHELEQMRIALAKILLEEIGLNGCDALELADRFYGEVATSLQEGDQLDLADYGYVSRRGGSASNPGYSTAWTWHR